MKNFVSRFGLIALLATARISLAQNISGTVLASDTGAPIFGALVMAVGVTSSPSQPPVMYQARTNTSGTFTLATAAGQYRMCASGGGPYLNPCLWGGVTTVSSGAAALNLTLQKGALFIARVHTSTQALSQTETVHGSAIAPQVAGGPFTSFPLPLIYESASTRDYGAILPLNLAMTLVMTSRLSLTDSTGAAVSPQGAPLSITSADFAPAGGLAVLFGGAPIIPAAKILHFYVNP